MDGKISTPFKPAMMFKDHAVLQQGKPIPVWGEGPEGATVEVSFLGRTYTATVEGGRWQVVLDATGVHRHEVLVMVCGEVRVEVREVSVGEVWIAGGQSNMEFFLRYDAERDRSGELEPCDDIWFFDYPEVCFPGQLELNDYSSFGFWRTCGPEDLDYWSAVGYWFARELWEELRVPVGVVGCNWGGTTASTWMDPAYLTGTVGQVWLDEYQVALDALDQKKYEEQTSSPSWSYTGKPFDNWVNEKLYYGLSERQMKFLCKHDSIYRFFAKFWPSMGPKSPYRPGGLYESMLCQVAPYAVRGVLWYQGESDDVHAEVYDVMLERLIRCWRDLWDEELPFLVVQIAPLGYFFNGEPWRYPLLREQQDKVCGDLDGVWLTTSGDTGIEWDVHPKRKRPVGRRLVLLARGHVYGEEILCDPPELAGVEVGEGRLALAFENAAGGLVCDDPSLPELVCSVDGQAVEDARISLEGSTVVVASERIRPGATVEASYACEPWYVSHLFNGEGIPAKPFHVEACI